MKRLLLYVHYNKYAEVSEHVLYQLKKMAPLFSHILVISNSFLSKKDEAVLACVADEVIQRKNKGYDFGAWRDAMHYFGFENLKDYDSITLMNDTCFGPLYDMQIFYEDYEAREVDLWGITNHRTYREHSRDHYFPEHIQSYYKVFSNKVIKSAVFENFWRNIQDFDNVQDVIDHYEIKSTSIFTESGFQYETVLDTRFLDASRLLHPDFSYFAPEVILNKKVPFIKVKTFQSPINEGVVKYMLDYIGENSCYPKEKIIYHLSMMGYPDNNDFLSEKYLIPQQEHVCISQKIAIHLHVFYTELFGEFLNIFNTFNFKYDLYITTDTKIKEINIKNQLIRSNTRAKVMLTENSGRDILPFLSLRNELCNYDIIGHFHTKRSTGESFLVGESWRKELISMLLEPANDIMSQFELDEKLGIVIADVPSLFRLNRRIDADNENTMIAPIMNDLWKRMKMSKTINFHDFKTYTMSYGNYFWAKTEVLTPLFDLELLPQEIPEEPLSQNTIIQVIERLLVYMAWDQGLDFRISRNSEQLPAFIDARTFNQRFRITEENAKSLRLRFVLKLVFKKSLRLLKYRTYKLLGRSLSNKDSS
ncbi:rhamnan synthesis F family protein [Lactococcus garvieae]|uniref:rhamnan synthesis F family protein n=1 Tax=Lactococcus garvieae TaxID=1363 RepID=UPI003852E0B3